MWRLSGEESWQPFNVGALSDREERPVKADKYIGMDVHQATTVVVVLNGEGKVVLETIVATEGARHREVVPGAEWHIARDL